MPSHALWGFLVRNPDLEPTLAKSPAMPSSLHLQLLVPEASPFYARSFPELVDLWPSWIIAAHSTAVICVVPPNASTVALRRHDRRAAISDNRSKAHCARAGCIRGSAPSLSPEFHTSVPPRCWMVLQDHAPGFVPAPQAIPASCLLPPNGGGKNLFGDLFDSMKPSTSEVSAWNRHTHPPCSPQRYVRFRYLMALDRRQSFNFVANGSLSALQKCPNCHRVRIPDTGTNDVCVLGCTEARNKPCPLEKPSAFYDSRQSASTGSHGEWPLTA
ncbi:hypothetical protein IQ07DRAFT_32339 [Pyrenochaeta sp. DS3sAY3a]|nr:hypothetical protein IQ07DRAFT_32339 [Pyrenochaeta sp. DS3sAY3a]